MTREPRRPLLLTLLCLAAILITTPVRAADLAIRNVRVVDVERGVVGPPTTVLVKDGRISALDTDPTQSGEIEAAEIVDGTAQFLIPGLIDMHVHTDTSGLPLLLEHGVTTIRDMGTHFAPLEPDAGNQRKWRDEVDDGSRIGPEMFTAFRILDGDLPRNPQWAMHFAAVATPEQGEELVDRLHAMEADLVKIYTDLKPEVFAAIAQRAAKYDMPLAGHVPGLVGYTAATEAGLRTAEHLRGLFIDLSSEEERWRRGFADAAAQGDLAATYNFTTGRLLEMAETYDEAKAEALFALFRENGVGIVPTLVVLNDPRWTFPAMIPDPALTGRLSPIYQRIVTPWDEAKGPFKSVSAGRATFERQVRLVGDMHAAGVDILVGTDFANPFVLPGISVHEEMGNLVRAGLTPAEALRAATWTNARYLDAEHRIGSIAEGKEADLVLLSANPLDDIANTQAIEAVFHNGRRYEAPTPDRD